MKKVKKVKKRARGAWVVTGAASGFGREMARRLVARGDTVALWDVSEDALSEAARELRAAHAEVVDVRDANAVSDAAARTIDAIGAVAHVVNSAGILRVGDAIGGVSPDDYRLMMEVNYLGSVHVARAFVPELSAASARDGGDATLLLIVFVAGLRGFPELAGYSASKFAVVGFAQALRDELAGSGVDVRVLCPPPGDTPMVRALPELPAIYKLSRMFTAEEVVDAALRGLETDDHLLLVDAKSKLLWGVSRAAPSVVDLVVRRATKPRR